jgi:hypothetical protein
MERVPEAVALWNDSASAQLRSVLTEKIRSANLGGVERVILRVPFSEVQ